MNHAIGRVRSKPFRTQLTVDRTLQEQALQALAECEPASGWPPTAPGSPLLPWIWWPTALSNFLLFFLDGPDTYWAEVRPAEDGRTVIVKRTPDGEVQEITPPGFSSVSTVREYGTRSFSMS